MKRIIKTFGIMKAVDVGDGDVDIKCTRCDDVVAHSDVDYFGKHHDASDVWLLQLSDDHRKQCTAGYDRV